MADASADADAAVAAAAIAAAAEEALAATAAAPLRDTTTGGRLQLLAKGNGGRPTDNLDPGPDEGLRATERTAGAAAGDVPAVGDINAVLCLRLAGSEVSERMVRSKAARMETSTPGAIAMAAMTRGE